MHYSGKVCHVSPLLENALATSMLVGTLNMGELVSARKVRNLLPLDRRGCQSWTGLSTTKD